MVHKATWAGMSGARVCEVRVPANHPLLPILVIVKR